MIKKISLLISGVFLSNIALFAQDVNASANAFDQIVLQYLPWIMLTVMVFLLGIIMMLAYWIFGLLDYIKKTDLKEKDGEEKTEEEDAISKFFKKVEHSLTDAVPVEREREIEFAHEYDGIRELDNSLPPWWKYMFYISIIFAIVYWYRYHVSGSAPLSAEEYKQEIAEAELKKAAYLEKVGNLVNESNVAQLIANSDLENGKKAYTNLCVACHGSLGEGKPTLGPNLTDEYWIHGGSIKNVFTTIKYGVQGKAMVSWQEQLSPKQMQEVASYVLSLQGTNPPNAKEPEGEKYIPENTAL